MSGKDALSEFETDISELNALLRDVQRTGAALKGVGVEAPAYSPMAPAKKATSAWARSTSARDSFGTNKNKPGGGGGSGEGSGPSGAEAHAAALAVRVKAPSASMKGTGRTPAAASSSSSSRKRGAQGDDARPRTIYNVKHDTLSASRAAPSYSFGKAEGVAGPKPVAKPVYVTVHMNKRGKENSDGDRDGGDRSVRSKGAGGPGADGKTEPAEGEAEPEPESEPAAPSSSSSVESPGRVAYGALRPGKMQGKAYSFGKEARHKASKPVLTAETLLDLERASGALRRHVAGVTMKLPQSCSRLSLDAMVVTEEEVSATSALTMEEDASMSGAAVATTTTAPAAAGSGASTDVVDVKVDYQSHRPHLQTFSFGRAPGTNSSGYSDGHTTMSATSSRHKSIVKDLLSGVLEDEEREHATAAQSKLAFGADAKGGATIRGKTERKKPKGVLAPSSAALAVLLPGPGHYDTVAAVDAIRQHVPSAHIVAPKKDSDVSVHMLRKRYWEDKARDLRDDHDGMKTTSYAAVEAHVPTTKIYTPVEGDDDEDIDFDSDNRRARVQGVRRQRRAEDAMAGTTPLNVAEAMDTLDKTAPAPAMEAQARAEAFTKSMLQSKPNVLAAMHARKQAEMARDRFLGPQLPVAWAPPRSGSPQRHSHAASSDPGSPTRDVLEMLALRERLGGAGGEDGAWGTAARSEEEYTEAYLAGQYAGNLKHVQGPKMVAAAATKSRKVKYEPELEILSTQVPVDWGVEKEEDKHSKALRMALDRGRDEKRKDGMGRVVVKKFTDLDPKMLDPVYEADTSGGFGVAAKGVVTFEKLVARGEAVGPYGEKPTAIAEAAKEAAKELEKLGDFNPDFNEEGEGLMLELDQRVAKEALEKHVQVAHMSKNPRFPELKAEDVKKTGEAAGRLGGEWFKGMADEVLEAADGGGLRALDFDMMSGRGADAKDDAGGGDPEEERVMAEELGAMGNVYGGGDVLELDVTDWKPHKAPLETAVAWRTAEEQPRWAKERQGDGPPPEYDVNPDVLRGKPTFLVDMDKGQDRWDGMGVGVEDEETGIVEAYLEYVDGDPGEHGRKLQEAFDAGLASDQMRSRTRAEEASSSARRMVEPVNMAKQRSRDDEDRAGGLVTAAPQDVDYDVEKGLRALEKRLQGGVCFEQNLGREDDGGGGGGVATGPSLSNVLGSEFGRTELELVPKEQVSSMHERLREVGDWSKDTAPAHTAGDPPKTAASGLDGKYQYDPDVLKAGPTTAPAMVTEQDRFVPNIEGPLVRGMESHDDREGDNIVLGGVGEGESKSVGRLPAKRTSSKKLNCPKAPKNIKRTEAPPYVERVKKTTVRFVDGVVADALKGSLASPSPQPTKSQQPSSSPKATAVVVKPVVTAAEAVAVAPEPLDMSLVHDSSAGGQASLASPPPSIHAPTPTGPGPAPAPGTKDLAALEESFRALDV